MGLFSTETKACTICGGEVAVNGSEGGECVKCGAAVHYECLKRSGNAKKKSRLIRGDKIKTKCPNCGHVA